MRSISVYTHNSHICIELNLFWFPCYDEARREKKQEIEASLDSLFTNKEIEEYQQKRMNEAHAMQQAAQTMEASAQTPAQASQQPTNHDAASEEGDGGGNLGAIIRM